jgi:hypothetical protein
LERISKVKLRNSLIFIILQYFVYTLIMVTRNYENNLNINVDYYIEEIETFIVTKQ